MMKDYPRQVTIGTAPYRETYILQADQFLLKFTETLDDERIDGLLRQLRFEPLGAESIPRHVETLRAAKMRWVALPTRPQNLADLAFELTSRHEEIQLAAPVYFTIGGGSESAASPMPDFVLVRCAERQERRALRDLKQLGLERNDRMSEHLKPFHGFNLQPFRRDENGNVVSSFEVLERVAETPGVENAEFDWLKLQTYLLIPNDTFWANQWNMAQIDLVDAWDVQTGTGGVWIAIIDSGFDLGHPDLAYTPNTGSNLTHFNAEQALAGDPPPYDAGPSGVPHGTAVAGLAAAILNNSAGVAGVAGGCTIMPVRLGTVPTAARVAAGINWAASNGALVANLSLTTTATAAVIAAVTNAWAAGMVLCAATGNSGGNATSPPIGFPANHANAIAVGASDQADQRKRPVSADGECWGSQFGPELDVVAPGVLCWTTDEQAGAGYNNNNGGPMTWACVNYTSSGDASGDYFALFDGTSAATPHVAGLAALLFSEYPVLTNQQIRDIIERTCDKVSSGMYTYDHTAGRPNGTWHQEMGHGRINCNAALRYADVMIADHDLDTGEVPSTELVGGVWTPRVFWRYQPYVTTTDQPTALPHDHEPAMAGQDNYVHAVVVNRGPATASNILVTWHIMDFPGTELRWPDDWNAANQIASANIASLVPGASTAVQAVWPQALVNIASVYAHPCMVVQAICNQDVGGDLSERVWDYNNIAQHNISFAGFASGAGLDERRFTLPFAVGHRLSLAREALLLFDLRAAGDAEVLLDVNPDVTLPYVERIRDLMRRHPPRVIARTGCEATFLEDARLLLECCDCRTEVRVRKDSSLRLLCDDGLKPLDLAQLSVKGAIRVMREGREMLSLEGPLSSVRLPLVAGQVVPMALTVQVPEPARSGTRFLVDVTQISEGLATGGVSLDIKAR